jgi:TPR repeat protein
MFMDGLGGRAMVLRPGMDANSIYAEGMARKQDGDCTGAIERLRPVAMLGPGYENAQTALGECLLQTGTGTEFSEGVTWLQRAADAGWPEAQGRLAVVHATGAPGLRDLEAAAMWLALYRGNTGKARVGFVPMPEKDLAAADAALTPAAKEVGRARAATWQRKVWLPPTPPAQPGPSGKERRRGPRPM